MGDPASISPELCVRSLSSSEIYDVCCPIIVGDAAFIRNAMSITGMPQLIINEVNDVKDAAFVPGTLDVLSMHHCAIEDIQIGQVGVASGDASFAYVRKLIELAQQGELDATVTNAISKEAINLAGHHFAGHTEIYAHYTKTNHYAMLLVHDDMRIVHVSTHVSLRDACNLVTKARVLEVIRIADKVCRDLGIVYPRVGVAGLNPHCGESGLFGREEIEEINPAIQAAKEEGIDAIGPVAPDTAFAKARGGWYDIVVAMYHDQGHIPLKLLGFVFDRETQRWQDVSGVNITLGLPIIRTSVDHGTAFDQAGHGTASPASLSNAIAYAAALAKNRVKSVENT